MKLLITIICLSCSLAANSQNDINSDLLALEEQYYFSLDSIEKAMVLIEKINCHISHQNFNEQVISEAKRLKFSNIKDSATKSNLYWNLALIGLINNNLEFADNMLFALELQTQKKSVSSELLKLHLYRQSDSLLFVSSLTYLTAADSAFNCFDCLQLLGDQEVMNEKKMLLYSKIIPGWGTIKAGDTRSGLFSIATHAGTIAGSVVLLRYGLYFNAVTWGVSLLPRFYSGNKTLTQKAVRKANQIAVFDFSKKCQEQTELLLAKYPLAFRY